MRSFGFRALFCIICTVFSWKETTSINTRISAIYQHDRRSVDDIPRFSDIGAPRSKRKIRLTGKGKIREQKWKNLQINPKQNEIRNVHRSLKNRVTRETLAGEEILYKCCPINTILDNFYECQEEERAESIFWNTLEEDGISDFKEVKIGRIDCPVGERQEFEVVMLPGARSAVVLVDSLWDHSEKTFMNHVGSFNYSCIDIKYKQNHAQDPAEFSLIAVRCQDSRIISVQDENTIILHPTLHHTIRKCCGPDEELNIETGTCAKQTTRNKFWFPPRLIHSNHTLQSTSNWSIQSSYGFCSSNYIQIIDKVVHVLNDGTIVLKDGSKLEYHCLDHDKYNQIYGYICIPKSGCSSTSCVSKCCPSNQTLQIEGTVSCVSSLSADHLWRFNTSQDTEPVPEGGVQVSYHHQFLQLNKLFPNKLVNCKETVKLDELDEYYLLQNGSLYLKEYGLTENYCVDNILVEGRVEEVVIYCIQRILQEQLFKNTSEYSCTRVSEGIFQVINTISGAISEVFLLITFLVYMSIPELKNLHGCIVLSNVGSIFLVTLYIIVVYNANIQYNTSYCVGTGYVGYFLCMSMFAWMSVMCFDLCWTFLRAKVPRKGSPNLKFSIYSLVAWGFGGLMTLLLLIVQKLEISPLPNVGIDTCFLSEEAQGLYLHLPVFILMLINGFLFCLTIISLVRSRMSTQMARRVRQNIQSSGLAPGARRAGVGSGGSGHLEKRIQNVVSRINTDSKEQLLLYTKLFTVMGVLWMAECVHYLLHREHKKNECFTLVEFIFRLFGCINLLRGFLFFIIFVCKTSTLNKVGNLSICGYKLEFLKTKQTVQFESCISNRSLITTNRMDSEQGMSMVVLKQNFD